MFQGPAHCSADDLTSRRGLQDGILSKIIGEDGHTLLEGSRKPNRICLAAHLHNLSMEEGERGNISLEGPGSFPSYNETGPSRAKDGRASYGRFADILTKKSFE